MRPAAARPRRIAERLARRIATDGPVSMADYMATALCDPRDGYYRTADPIGAAGDFTTAPEISQMFGELIGAWLIDCWDKAGRPEPVKLIELGPGRGTLMRDALRVGSRIDAWRRAVELHLVEINGGLRALQAAKLGAFRPTWHESLATVPDGPTLLVANEFFDALPVHQMIFRSGTWRERLVGWSEAGGFHFVLAPTPSPLAALLPSRFRTAGEDDLIEVSPASIGVAGEIARRVSQHPGAALLIDYGTAATATGDTVTAVSHHRAVSVLGEPGSADLSAHVDFEQLARAAREQGASVLGPVTQARFLQTLGIGARAARLKERGQRDAMAMIDGAVERMTGRSAMGELFKVIAIAHPTVTPAGFTEREAGDVPDRED